VPNEWTDVDTAPLTFDDGTQAPFIKASTDIATFDSSWDAPGLFYAALTYTEDIPGTIALVAPSEDQCTTDNGVTDYDDGVFTGQYQFWSDCGASAASYVALVANPGDASYTAVIAVQILTDADWEALDTAFATFNVVTE
jgi:serine protease Do